MTGPEPVASRGSRAILALALVLTLLAGVAMRWALAGRIPMIWDLGRLRHAHAHLGYYGVLIPLAWLAWRSVGIRAPSRGVLAAYSGCVVLAIVGFLRAGYAPEAVVGSTIVGAIWLGSAWQVRGRLLRWSDPLGGLLPGMVLALGCVPFVARFTRVEPGLAQQWVATFLSALLFLVVLPTALGVLRVGRPWPLLVCAGTLGALGLGVWPHPAALTGLGLFGALLLPLGWPSLPAHLRLVWAALGLGVILMALGVLPNVRPVVIGAIHFAALGVALPSFARLVGFGLHTPYWWFHHAAVGLLCAPLIAQAFGGGRWTWDASAIGGTAVLAVILAAIARAATDPRSAGTGCP